MSLSGLDPGWPEMAPPGSSQPAGMRNPSLVSVRRVWGNWFRPALKAESLQRKKPKVGIRGERGGDPDFVKFFHRTGLNYVSCCRFWIPTSSWLRRVLRSKFWLVVRSSSWRQSSSFRIPLISGEPFFSCVVVVRWVNLGLCGANLRARAAAKILENRLTVNNLQLLTGWTGAEFAVSGVINTQIIKKVDHIVKFN